MTLVSPFPVAGRSPPSMHYQSADVCPTLFVRQSTYMDGWLLALAAGSLVAKLVVYEESLGFID